jgi:hypothetical protein
MKHRSHLYVLGVDGEPLKIDDPRMWADWFETADRVVRVDQVGEVRVSTVFLALDHVFGGGRPLLWETMIFGGVDDGYQQRYPSRADALIGHTDAIARVKATQDVTGEVR